MAIRGKDRSIERKLTGQYRLSERKAVFLRYEKVFYDVLIKKESRKQRTCRIALYIGKDLQAGKAGGKRGKQKRQEKPTKS